MSLVRLDWSAPVRSRFAWSLLLCAVAMGIVGMHGLTQGGETSQTMGHHVAQTVDVVPAAATSGSQAVSSDSSPSEGGGLTTLCLMVLVPAVAVGQWLLVRSRIGGWRARRVLCRRIRTKDVARPPAPPWRRATVLRI